MANGIMLRLITTAITHSPRMRENYNTMASIDAIGTPDECVLKYCVCSYMRSLALSLSLCIYALYYSRQTDILCVLMPIINVNECKRSKKKETVDGKQKKKNQQQHTRTAGKHTEENEMKKKKRAQRTRTRTEYNEI